MLAGTEPISAFAYPSLVHPEIDYNTLELLYARKAPGLEITDIRVCFPRYYSRSCKGCK